MTNDPPRVSRVTHEPRAWWRALGGPDAISIWSWIVTSGVAVLVAAIYEVPNFDYRLWERIGLVLMTQVILIPSFLLGFVALKRLRSPVPVLGLSIFVGIGVLRGVVITLIAPSIEPLARPAVGYQVIVGVTYALLSLPFIAVVVDALRRHRALQARLLTAQDRWEVALRTTEIEFNEEYALYRGRVESEVNARIITLTDELASVARDAATAGAVTAAEELRRLSAEVVRPLSHELILEAPVATVAPLTFAPPPPLLGLRDVLRDAPRSPTAGHWVVCGAMVLLSTVGLAPLTTSTFIAVNIAWDVVVFGCVPVLVRMLGDSWWRRLPPQGAWIASAFLWLGLAVLGVAGTAALGGLITGDAVFYWSAGFFYVLISAGTVVAWAGFRRLRALDAEYVSLLADQEDLAARLMARLDRDRRHLGLVLHGSVQSSLAHAARTLELWATTMNPAALPGVVAEVRKALDAALESVDVGPPLGESLSSALDERVALWADAIECTLSISAEVREIEDPLLVEHVADITGEAITNAVRHGHADHVAVTVDLSGGALALVVSDNGLGPGESMRAGGGLGHLLRSGYVWKLERQGARTVLSVRIPLTATPPPSVMETEQAGISGP